MVRTDTIPPRPRHLVLRTDAPRNRELFAKKKGIKTKGKQGKLVFDEEKQAWVPKWGYKPKNKGEVDDQWLVEVDDNDKK